MRKIIFLMLFPSLLLAQDGAFRYFISFTDKSNTSFSLERPEEYLSVKTVAKRQKFSIEIDSTDLPVSSIYIDNIKSLGFVIENRSRWFNGVVVSSYDSLLITSLEYAFIDSIVHFGNWKNTKNVSKKWNLYDSIFNFIDRIVHTGNWKNTKNVSEKWNLYDSIFDYSLNSIQIEMLGGDLMHSKGFKGDGIIIAVIDAGFYNVDKLNVFSALQNQILSTYDFVDGNANVYDDHTHGMMVLSTIAARDELVGSAPEAKYILLRSEDVFSENLIEEFMWVAAAEYADSMGADIINSSLGYTTFDNVNQNHTYADMDGKTTPISIGAGIACDKGIIVVNSAGNSGNSNWHYIGAPADNFDVLTVGAVDEDKEFASFSSHGPSIDGSIKPNIVAQGKNVVVANSNNEYITSNGTSFASPLIAGMTACLWGAHSNKSANSIKEAIYKSSDKYLMPNNQFGYGIPNYYAAYSYLNSEFLIPINETIVDDLNYVIYSIEGKIIDSGKIYYNDISDFFRIVKPKIAGVYIINLTAGTFELNKKFIVSE